jgi:signal transduction histidine kinase
MQTDTGMSVAEVGGGASAGDVMPADQSVSPADLGALLKSFNDVTARLSLTHESLTREVVRLKAELSEANRQVQTTRHLAMLGEMAAGIAHEIRNPLGSIMLYARHLQEDLADRPGCQTTAGKIVSAVTRLDAIVRDVLSFSRETRLSVEPIVARELLENALESARDDSPVWRGVSAEVVVAAKGSVGAPIEFSGDSGLLHQALVNVIRNAAEATTEGGRAEKRLVLQCAMGRVMDADGTEREMVMLTVTDTGPGVSDDVAARMFNPFFTTRAAGTGLGLAIVHRIIDAHGGRVSIRNVGGVLGRGAAVEIALPARGGGGGGVRGGGVGQRREA